MSELSTWQAALLGVLQGITEFLPVSSSAHLIVLSAAMSGESLPLPLSVALHLGTLGSVLAYFWRDWLRLGKALLQRLFYQKKSFDSDQLFPGLIIGSVPAAFFGILWEDQIEAYFHRPISVVLPMFLVGLALWLVDKKAPATKGVENIGLRESFLIGLGQACALIPGFSRSGSTILAARLLKIRREDAAKYSFLLGTPAMVGATLLESRKILQYLNDPIVPLGVLVSFLTGCLCIGFLLKFLRRFGFLIFAVYRLLFALAVLGFTLAST